MNTGGDAAEQVVRLSLEGFEVAAKLTGTAAKELTVLLVSVLKQEHRRLSITICFLMMRERMVKNSRLSSKLPT